MNFTSEYIWLLTCIPFIAFLYASVGHGGASGYIALMYIFNISVIDIKPIALVMNLFVASIAFYHYSKQGYFKFNVFIFFAIGSIPFSFVGGYLKVDPLVFNSLLCLFLIFSIFKLSGVLSVKSTVQKVKFRPISAIIIGAIIGFSSGLIGIGGGIILTPILLLLHWVNMKEAAAVSALFILVNSFAGLTGQLFQGVSIPHITWPMVLTAIVGGFAGSYLGANLIGEKKVKGILVLILVIACVKISYSLWKIV